MREKSSSNNNRIQGGVNGIKKRPSSSGNNNNANANGNEVVAVNKVS